MRRLLFALALTCASCSATTPVIEPTTDPSGSVSPSPTQPPAPKVPKARAAVIATGSEVVFYDAAADTERVLVTGEGLQQARFLSRHKITYLQSAGAGRPAIIHLHDLRTDERQELLRVDDGIGAYGVDRDRTKIAYVTMPSDGRPKLRVQSLVGSRPTLDVVTLASILGRGVTPDDQLSVEFDRRGERFLMVFTFADEPGMPPERSMLQVRSATGALEFAGEHDRFPTQAIWSPNTKQVYFRTSEGVFRWSVGSSGAARIAPTQWFTPRFSPDRDRIAYGVGGHSTGASVELLHAPTASRSSVPGQGITRPVFAAQNLLWVQRLEPCAPDSDCFEEAQPAGVEKLNLVSGKRKPIALRSLGGVDVFYA